jgi:hypothetical protein
MRLPCSHERAVVLVKAVAACKSEFESVGSAATYTITTKNTNQTPTTTSISTAAHSLRSPAAESV